jgi:adenylate kinase
VLDTHIPGGIISPESVRMVFVLRCHPIELEKRLRKRGWSKGKILENILSEILDSCLIEALDWYGRRKVCEIDVTKLSTRKAIDSAMKILKGNMRKDVGKIDWIAELERAGVLEKYLRRFKD